MFADVLKQLRAELGVSQGKLAKAIGVSGGNVSAWESGEAKPGYTALYSLAQFFGVSADYLLELSPQKKGEADDSFQLLEDIKKQKLSCDDSPLSSIEADLVAMFRLLTPEGQEDVFDIVYLKYKRRVERKRESIYWTYFDESENTQSDPAGGHETQGGTA